MNEKYYIVRADRAGVFFGNIKERNGSEVTMTNVRRLWYWDGACAVEQLAVNGRDIIDMGVTGGKQIGRLLNLLLDSVIDGTLPNEKAALLAAAKEYSVKE